MKKKKKEKDNTKKLKFNGISIETENPQTKNIHDKFNNDKISKLKSKIDKRREDIKNRNKKFRSDILNKSRDIDKTLDNFETPYTHAPIKFHPKHYNVGEVRKQLEYDDTSILSPNQKGEGFIWQKRKYF